MTLRCRELAILLFTQNPVFMVNIVGTEKTLRSQVYYLCLYHLP